MNIIYRLIFLVILSSAAGACSNPSPTPLPTDTPRPTATPVPTNTPSPTATPIPTNTPIPPALHGTVPDGWQSIKIPITDVEFAVPSEWAISEQVAGFVEIGKLDGWFFVTFEERLPTSRLSLYQFMQNSSLRQLYLNAGIGVQLVDSGEIPDIPLYWAKYGSVEMDDGSVESVWVGSIVTPKGTILIELTGTSLRELEEIARTVSFPAPPLTLE